MLLKLGANNFLGYKKIFYFSTLSTALKKIIAILLLALHVFNFAGYGAVFNLLQQRASTQIVDMLDKGAYDETELMEVKIPFPLPYATNWKEYERCDGEFEISGVIYNYVKRKLCNDTLFLLCIPNHEMMKIATAKSDFAQVSNDFANTGNGKKSQPVSTPVKSGINEYNQSNSFCNVTGPLYLLLNKTYPLFDLKPVLRSVPVPLQPPNFNKA